MNSSFLPRMALVRQRFSAASPVDVRSVIETGLAERLRGAGLGTGAEVAVAVGSRGISGLREMVAATVRTLQQAGCKPFIVPAMGSHGGATPEGQSGVLLEYGISEAELGVPIRASMEVVELGKTAEGVTVYCTKEAASADGVVVINRIKPHTDFQGSIGSGLLKMLVVGLGKRIGATNYHHAAGRLGYEMTLRAMARIALRSIPVIAGIAVVEGGRHETAMVEVVPPNLFEEREDALFIEAARLLPKLPFDDVDLLIVDQIGKNISGAGLDPNVTGRWVHGYSTSLGPDNRPTPMIRRLFVREPTPETHGNVIGIGFADATTSRLINSMDKQSTYINAMTSTTLNSAKIPIHFDSDREAIERLLGTLGLSKVSTAKIIRIRNTLELEKVAVSEAYLNDLEEQGGLEVLLAPTEMEFDPAGNLGPIYPATQ